MASLNDLYKKPVQPALFDSKIDMSCDSKGNDKKRMERKLKKQPTFMFVGRGEFQCFICKKTTNHTIYVKELFCLNCNIFHDKTDAA